MGKIRRATYATIVVILMSFGIAEAQQNTLYTFLNMPVNARQTALGGTQIVLGTDVVGTHIYNPSLLTDTLGTAAAINIAPLVDGIMLASASYQQPLTIRGVHSGNVALAIEFLKYGKIEEYDEAGTYQGSRSTQDVAIVMSYGRQFGEQLSIGAQLKPVISSLAGYTSFGLVMDMGVTFIARSKRFRASAVLQNVGGQIKKYTDEGYHETIHPVLSMGLAYKTEHAPFRITYTFYDITNWDLTAGGSATKKIHFGDNLLRHSVLGLEFVPAEVFWVGAGYNQRRRKEMMLSDAGGVAGFSWGTGVKIKRVLTIEYGGMRYHKRGSLNTISLSYKIR